jgi:hypothetical protein
MFRNKLGLVAVLAAVIGVGLFSAQNHIKVDREMPINVTPIAAGAINGSVPTIQYDNMRVYVQIALPMQPSPLSDKVLQTFGGDAVIRQNSIVRVNKSDKNFEEYWGDGFIEAKQGIGCVAIILENGGQVQALWKAPVTSEQDLNSLVKQCQAKLLDVNLNCPNCPKPSPSTPSTPSPQTNPSLPPIPNSVGPDAVKPSGETDWGMVGLVAAVSGFLSWAVVFKRGK